MLMIGNIYNFSTLKEEYPQQWRQESYQGVLINIGNGFLHVLDRDLGFVKIYRNQLFEFSEVGEKDGNIDSN